MQAFGIELRRVNTLPALFQEVDRTLAKMSLVNTQAMAVGHALHKMIGQDRHFSVCTVDKCAEIAQVVIPIERKRIYSSAHCMDWGAMTPEFRNTLIAMVLDDFRAVLYSQEAGTLLGKG